MRTANLAQSRLLDNAGSVGIRCVVTILHMRLREDQPFREDLGSGKKVVELTTREGPHVMDRHLPIMERAFFELAMHRGAPLRAH
jgi:hypothetical protein